MSAKARRLEMRISAEHKDLLEQAASLQGQPLTSFAIAALLEKARDVLSRHEATLLSRRDMRAFVELLGSREGPNARLRAAHQRWKAVRER